jgi:HlyD family secretion protein
MILLRRALWPAFFLLLLIGGLTYALYPRPILVDMAQVALGELTISVADDGVTRVKDVYVVSAPVTGRVLRFEGHVGDAVAANDTVLVSILPTDPAFQDIRTRTELEAAVKAAEAARNLAIAEVARQKAELEYAISEFTRVERLSKSGHVSVAALDRARRDQRAGEAALETAQAAAAQREYELQTAQAALISPTFEQHGAAEAGSCCFAVRSPVSGRILKVMQESESVVPAGAPLVEIGDPRDLEIVVDLLSRDAVRVAPGNAVEIENWGGEETLQGEVRLIEPFGVTKISSLGIEEQRVNVIVDLTSPAESWARLGHGYHLDARIILWRGADALLVPVTALFRSGANWTLFRVENGRARLTVVEIGQLNDRYAQVISGLTVGETVIVHPSAKVSDNVRVVAPELSAVTP